MEVKGIKVGVEGIKKRDEGQRETRVRREFMLSLCV